MKSLWIIINLKFSVWKKIVYHRTTAPISTQLPRVGICVDMFLEEEEYLV